jgi:effector-binding domain-containing protein
MIPTIRPGRLALILIFLALTAFPASISQAAAPVLEAPKASQSGKTKTQGLPSQSLPGSGASQPADKPDGAHDHDHNTKSGGASVIETVKVPVLPVLARTAQASWDNGYAAIRKTIAELRTEATRAGLEPKGRPLIVYIENSDQQFRFDALLPLASAPAVTAKLSNGFRFGHNPGGKAMKFEHRGAYAEIESTYEAITAYLDEKGLSAREFFIEEIVNDVADPADIKSAVNIYVFLR